MWRSTTTAASARFRRRDGCPVCVDNRTLGHYPLDGMTGFRKLGVLLATLLAVGMAPPLGAAERKLFTLESAPAAAIELQILDVAGARLADRSATAATWKLKPGDTLRGETRPPDRVVDVFSGTRLAPSLLCRVVVHYYAGDSGWVPRYRLDDEPAVAFVNGRWQPIGGIAGLVRHGGVLPNADGFFPAIEFGLSSGALTIVAWRVR